MDHMNISIDDSPRYRVPASMPSRPHLVGISRLAVWIGTGLLRWGNAAASRRDTAAAMRRDRAINNFHIRRQLDEERNRRELAYYKGSYGHLL
ncbi:hypothetical protein [Paenarthrobacter sp. PH39-S1]|uniref:hypothetical protein n=1 Tax=Paenarthrobacter sp. PH39-S1 TaxID=3046204 RepID=UPI0024BB1A40|nr:hypothetical protein [Paenarthrobacter sp. PH39-S1]MDJ0356665.1 hypothetical protein [Paenarthrobacter sp. PH39-S1]